MKTKSPTVIMLAFVMVLFSHNSYSQSTCENTKVINTPAEQAFNRYVTRFKAHGGHLNTDLKIIPVVIHVVYRNRADSLQISRARLQGQIDATNRQLRRLNANAKDTRTIFLPVAADCNIQVCLATKKPDRSRFSGVIYHKYPHFDNSDAALRIIRAATILDPNKYLNVWVLPDRIGGSAIFPWQDSAAIDGFWVGAEWFGTTGSNLSSFMYLGTTFTHELGHYLGVLHSIEGGRGFVGACDRIHDGSIGDFCADTPLDWTFADGITEKCNDGIRNDCDGYICQTENFMYYNPDSCTNMFSKDQRARMRACLHDLRCRLVSPFNLAFTGVNCNDLPVQYNTPAAVSLASAGENYNDPAAGKQALEKKIIVFPNPTNGVVQIIYHDLPVKKDISIRIYNQVGQKLREVHSHTAVSELNLASFSEGVYYIIITIGSASVTKYIIKTGTNNLFFDK